MVGIFTHKLFNSSQSDGDGISDILPRPCKYVMRPTYAEQIGNNYG